MSERRASIRPPEMMNGSTNGSVSSNSSARVIRTRRHVEKMELAIAPREHAVRLELEHPRDQPVPRVEHERVQRARGARAVRRGVLRQGELEERVQLHALAAAPGVLEDHAARTDIPGADKRAVEGGGGRSQAVEVQDAQVAVAQVPASVGHL